MPVPDFSPGEVLTAAAMDSIGLWKTAAASVTAQPTLTVDNCFNANYENYRVIISMNGVSNSNFLVMRLLDSAGSQLTTAYVSVMYSQPLSPASTVFSSVVRTDGQALGYLPNDSSNGPMAVQFDIFRPFESGERTYTNGLHTGVESGAAFRAGATFMARTSQETNRGMLLFNNVGTNMTGTVRVYGYRN